MLRAITSLLLLIAVISANAQGNTISGSPDRLAFLPEFGFILPHRPHMKSLIRGHSPAFRLCAEWDFSGEKAWHQDYKNPSLGFEWQWIDLGNREELGYANSIRTYLLLPLFPDSKLAQHFKIGAGLVYLNKHWSLDENLKNLAAGSHYNISVNAHYQVHIPLSDKVGLLAGLGLTHFSNAAYQVPNLGMNIATVSLGLQLGDYQLEQAEHTITDVMKSSGIAVYGAFGLNENFPPDGPKYAAFNLGLEHSYSLNNKAGLLSRADVFFNEAVHAVVDSRDDEATSRLNSIQAGFAAGYGQYLGKFMIRLMMGVYVLDEYNSNGSFYHRFGVEQQVGNHLIVGLGLKTHFAKADHFEFGLGWKW